MNLAISISAIALLVSFLSFYRSYWYTKIELVAYLVFLELDIGENRYKFDCSVSNNGNKDILVMGLDLVSNRPLTPEINDKKIFPLVLKPGEIRLIPVNIPGYFVSDCKNHDQNFAIKLNVISSNGKFYQAKKLVKTQSEFLGDVLTERFLFKKGRD